LYWWHFCRTPDPRGSLRIKKTLSLQSCAEGREEKKKSEAVGFRFCCKDRGTLTFEDPSEEGVMKEKSKGVKENKKAPQKSLKEKRKMKKEKKNR